jgi:hypothetical protein
VSRRQLIGGLSLLPLAKAVSGRARRHAATASSPYRFFSRHEAAVVIEATARLVPGPQDDPLEVGHPGAREADVVRYIDEMLSAFHRRPARIHAGGPFSNRHRHGPDDMSKFVPLNRSQRYAWKRRIRRLRKTYRAGIRSLDAQAGGDFTAVPAIRQDLILASGSSASFMAVLFGHTIEGMYGVPEYGGNAGLVGWTEIGFAGDRQPKGFSADAVERSDGLDPVDPLGITEQLITGNLDLVARAFAERGWPHGRP